MKILLLIFVLTALSLLFPRNPDSSNRDRAGYVMLSFVSVVLGLLYSLEQFPNISSSLYHFMNLMIAMTGSAQ